MIRNLQAATFIVGSLSVPGWILYDNQKTTLNIRKAQLINFKNCCKGGGCKEFYDQQLRDLDDWDNKNLWSFIADSVPPVQYYHGN